MSDKSIGKEDAPILPEVLPPANRSDLPAKSELGSHYKNLTWRDGAEMLADAADLVGIGTAIKVALGLGKYSPEERLKERQFQWLIEQIPSVQKKLDALITQLPPEDQPQPTDVAAIIDAAIEASQKTAEARKRRLLRNALINAFDMQQYQAGLTLRLFAILKDVEYGDIELLRCLADMGETIKVESLKQPLSKQRVGVQDVGALQFHHLEVLDRLGLAVVWNRHDSPLEIAINAHTCISELGLRFLDFIAEPLTNEQ